MTPNPEETPFEQPAQNPDAAQTYEPNPHERIAELEAQIEALKREKLLALAEAENAGKRADRRIADNSKYAVSNIAKALLQVADNLGRALLAAPAEARASHDALKNLATGVELTEKELISVLDNNGVRKINVDTDIRLAMTAELRETVMNHPAEFDPRAFFKAARKGVREVVSTRMTQFGQAGHAGDYEVLPLSAMIERYSNGG